MTFLHTIKLFLFISIIISSACQEATYHSKLITMNQSGGLTLYGKKIALEDLKPMLLDSLMNMSVIPEDIDIGYDGEVLMGTRSEIETLVLEAIAEAKGLRSQATVTTRVYRKQNGADCDQPEMDRTYCATIDFQYPFVASGSDILNNRVNKWVGNYLTGILTAGADGETRNVVSLDEAAKVFFETHESYKGSVVYGAFVADCGNDVLLNNGKHLTLAINGNTYQGGAHGSPSAIFGTFDVVTGEQLDWDNLVTDKAALKVLAEKKFRAERADAFNNGFDFDDTFRFKLPDNYGLIESGIYMHYEHYEVGPYAMGSTTFVLPFAEIGHLSKTNMSGSHTLDQDEIAVKNIVHGFYTWYEIFQNDEKRNISYTKEVNNHLTLDMPKLNQYFANIKASGYISDQYINSEIKALQECEIYWQKESLDEPPSCLDYNRFYCLQDWIGDTWNQAPLSIEETELDNIVATMPDNGQKIILNKENGRWMITQIPCE